MSKENWHFHRLGTKRSSQYQEKGLGKRLVCNLRLTLSMICLYRKMRHKGVRYESFLFPVCFRIVVLFAVVLEIVTQGVCLCVTTPRATSRKIAPFCFLTMKQSRWLFFGRFRFWKTLVCGLLCVEMQTAWQRLVWFVPQRLTRCLSKAELSSLSLDLNQLVP